MNQPLIGLSPGDRRIAGRSGAWWTGLFLVAISGTALLVALMFEHVVKLPPCEMCYWQRYGHLAVIGFGLLAMVTNRRWASLAALGLLALAMLLALYHAGVEWGWYESPTSCAAEVAVTGNSADMFGRMLDVPLVRCNEVPWAFLGLSIAGWNAIGSAVGVLAASALFLWTGRKRQ